MLTTSVERREGSVVKLTVTVPSELVDAAIERTYKAAAKKVRVPGFRPGKAPRQMLDSMLGREYLMAEATEDVVNSTYSKALDIEGLRPVESPELEELDTVESGQEFTYWAEIEVRPELTLSGTGGLSTDVPAPEASESEIDAHIEVLRERFATLEPVEGRGVAADDFVLVSFVGLVEGEPYEGNEVDKYLYEMGRGLMPPEFDEGLMGVESGGEAHVEFLIPEGQSNTEFAGKKATFEVTVHEIKAKLLPEVDDELAANVGGFDDVAAMREDLRARLNVQKGVANAQAKERGARAALAERLEGEIPAGMTEQRQASMMRDFMSMLENQQITIEQYLAQSGLDMDTLESDVREQAIRSLKEELALEALFREQDMRIDDADIDAELSTMASNRDESLEETRARWEELGLMAVLREQIMHRKAIAWLLENVEFVVAEDAEDTEE